VLLKTRARISPTEALIMLIEKTTFAPVVIRASQGPQQHVPVRRRHHMIFLQKNNKKITQLLLFCFYLSEVPEKILEFFKIFC
jgi:hypothetical protein